MGGNLSSALCCKIHNESEKYKEEGEITKNYQGHYVLIKDIEYYELNLKDNPKALSKYIDHGKIVYHLNNLSYIQTYIEKYWGKIDIRSMNKEPARSFTNEALNIEWKFLIRKGVPLTVCKEVIKSLFQLRHQSFKITYKNAEEVTFKREHTDNSPVKKFRHWPTFSQHVEIEDMFLTTCLSTKGEDKLKEIMWILKKTTHLVYCPMIVSVTSLLMIFFNEDKTLKVLQMLTDMSYELLNETEQVNSAEKLRSLRWWLTFSEQDWFKFCQSFWDLLSNKSNSIKKGKKVLEEKVIDPHLAISEMFSCFFINI